MSVVDGAGRGLADIDSAEAAVPHRFDFRAEELLWWKHFVDLRDPGEAAFVVHREDAVKDGHPSIHYRLYIDQVAAQILAPQPTWLPMQPTRRPNPSLFSGEALGATLDRFPYYF